MPDERPVLRLGHSPDPDDVFMWWPIAPIDGHPVLDTGRFRYEPVLDDIESLNRRAEQAELEITAISCAQYPRVADRYAVTACGASIGDGYGPKLVARTPRSAEETHDSRPSIAIPGRRTSAFAAMSVWFGGAGFDAEEVMFDQIPEAVLAGRFDLGLVIHEGQLTVEDSGLHIVEDLGRWWRGRFDTVLPLGINTVLREIEPRHGPGTLREITTTLRRSIEYALDHPDEAVERCMPFSRGLDRGQTAEFIHLYVNRWTLHFGPEGEVAVTRFLAEAAHAGVCGPVERVDFICGD